MQLRHHSGEVPPVRNSRSPSAWLPAIQEALKGLRYGHIQIVIHDGDVVRVEKVERIRLPEDPGGHNNITPNIPTLS